MKTHTLKIKTDKGQQGFTLIETSIAMIVMMVSALACSSLFIFSMQNNVGGSERALAMAVAQQQLEEIRSVTFEDPTLAVGTTNSTATIGQRNYAVQKVVADEINPGDASPKKLRKITITVTPQTAGPNWTHTSVVLATFRSTLAYGNYLLK